MPTLSLEKLSELSGVSARTIRYYIARGVLDPPLIAGRNACYSEVHLDKLKLVKLAQVSGKSLDQIKAEYENLTKAGWKGRIGSPFYYKDIEAPDPEPLITQAGEPSWIPGSHYSQVVPGSERHCWTEGQVHPQVRVSIRNDLMVMHKELLNRVEQAIAETLKKEGV